MQRPEVSRGVVEKSIHLSPLSSAKNVLCRHLAQIGVMVLLASPGSLHALQDCRSGPADEVFELGLDTLVWNIDQAYALMKQALEDWDYEFDVADNERRLLLTAPSYRRPVVPAMDDFTAYDSPGVVIAVSVVAVDDSRIVISRGVRALCKITQAAPAGWDGSVEDVFEAAVAAELDQVVDSLMPNNLGSPGALSIVTADVQQPQTIRCPDPVMPTGLPDYARRDRVRAAFIVEASGTVDARSISLPDDIHVRLADAIRDVLTSCEFSPARQNGEPVRAAVNLEVRFRQE